MCAFLPHFNYISSGSFRSVSCFMFSPELFCSQFLGAIYSANYYNWKTIWTWKFLKSCCQLLLPEKQRKWFSKKKIQFSFNIRSFNTYGGVDVYSLCVAPLQKSHTLVTQKMWRQIFGFTVITREMLWEVYYTFHKCCNSCTCKTWCFEIWCCPMHCTVL